MASENETVADILKVMRERCIDENHSPSLWPFLDRIEAAHRREYEKYKEHINELNRQILVLKHEGEKRETYLCGYDPDEALVMQCGTCRFFQKKHSHCTYNDSLTNAKYKCNAWKFKTNDECAKEASKKHDKEIVKLRSEVAELEAKLSNTETARKFFARRIDSAKKQIAELRECLKEAVGEMCEYCKYQYSCDKSNCTNRTASKWRKALEGAKDEGK